MQPSKEILLKVEGLEVRYGQFLAVDNVSITVPRGTIVSIVGANGAGKSTLLKTISGLLKPARGTIQYQDTNATGWTAPQAVRAGISLVPEGSHVFARMSVLDNLLMGSYIPRARSQWRQNLDLVYHMFPILFQRRFQQAGTLSGGERQMLAIGRALMSQPTLLMLDEVSLGLAPIVIDTIYEKIREINSHGTTVLLVEQDIRRSLGSSSFTYVLLEGRIVLSGASSDLSVEEVTRAYFGLEQATGYRADKKTKQLL